MRLNLTKKDIINSLYLQIGYPKKVTENVLEDLFNIIFDELKKNGKVKITNFGTFTVRKKIVELAEIQKLKRSKLFLREMLFYLSLQMNLKKK